MDALRALENIIDLSFDEEGLMGVIKKTDSQDPRHINLGQTQRKLKDDAKWLNSLCAKHEGKADSKRG